MATMSDIIWEGLQRATIIGCFTILAVCYKSPYELHELTLSL